MTTMTKATFVNSARNTFFTLKTDIPNRRVTSIAGRIGTRGRTTVRILPSNDAVRNTADNLVDARLAAGFQQVA